MPTLLLRLLVVLVSFSAGAQTGPQPDCSAPPTSDGWQVASPDVVGLDPKLLCAIGPHFKTWTTANVHSVLVVRHDKLVYEQYFTGDDQKLGRAAGIVAYDATTKHDVRSIEKSVAALVLGIVIKQGRIAGIDQPVLQQFPEYADLGSSQKDQITLRHLLTMSQGLAWNEDRPYSDPANSEYQMDISPNPLRYALSPPVVAPPGTVWNYSTGSATILSLLRKRPASRSMCLCAPNCSNHWASRTMGAHLPHGDVSPYGLRMRPRDLIKLGQLVLNNGSWNGKSVVPADWIATATD